MTDENKVPEEIIGTNTEKKTNTRKRQTTKGRKTRNARGGQNQNIFKKSKIKKFVNFCAMPLFMDKVPNMTYRFFAKNRHKNHLTKSELSDIITL